MSKIADAEANATSLDSLVNDNALVPTLRNGPKPSYQYLVDGWNDAQTQNLAENTAAVNSLISESETEVNTLISASEAEINELLERTAGVGSENAYETTAAGLAATVNGDYFSVISPDDEGYLDLYKNGNGTAVFQKQYPSTEALINFENEVNEKVDSIPAKTDVSEDDLEVFADNLGNIVRRTNSDAEQFLPNMDNMSLQDAHREQKKTAYSGVGFRSKDVIQVEDSSGNITMRQDVTGGMYLPGLNGSIQGVTSQSVDKTTYFPTDDRDKLHPTIKPLITDLVVEGRPYIDPPTSLVPNNYFVPDNFVSSFSASPSSGMWLETPHHDGGLVHPYLLKMRKPLQGYWYWFMDTPHLAGSAEENPVIWGTNSLEFDKRRFDILPNLSQPLSRPPLGLGNLWNADEGLTYDPRSGKLIAYWIVNQAYWFRYRETYNGIDFTDEQNVIIPAEDEDSFYSASPAILFNPTDGLWHRWDVWPEGVLNHRTSTNFYDNWTLESSRNVNQADGIDVWHIEVKYIGEKYVIMMNNRENLFFGVSANGNNWTFGTKLLPDGLPVYKGTFEPEWDGDNLRFWVGWNAYSFPRIEGVRQELYIVPTNWVDITTL